MYLHTHTLPHTHSVFIDLPFIHSSSGRWWRAVAQVDVRGVSQHELFYERSDTLGIFYHLLSTYIIVPNILHPHFHSLSHSFFFLPFIFSCSTSPLNTRKLSNSTLRCVNEKREKKKENNTQKHKHTHTHVVHTPNMSFTSA